MALAVAVVVCAIAVRAAGDDWDAVLAEARNQTVYWNAWAGDERNNRYIRWVAAEMKRRFGVEVRHVKLSDTAEAVSRVVAEKAAGRGEGGSVDLIWINGENFASMKRLGLLFGPFSERLPNYRMVDTNSLPTLTDFTVPVDGMEAPWSVGRFVLMHDRERMPSPPRNPKALLAWATANPGRFAYPQPPDFLGTTFLKQLLVSLATDRKSLHAPVSDAEFTRISEPLWRYLDGLHPVLWRRGRAFPASGPALTRLLSDGEVDVSLAFSSDAASNAIHEGQLPATVRTFVFEDGMIGNASFLAIPFNARAKAGAQVLVDFLLSPAAQARKQDPREVGSQTVLAISKLKPEDRALFDMLPRGVATLSNEELGPLVPEPHPFWTERLEKEWRRRYGTGR